MSIHEHEVRTKTDRLIAAVEALTTELRLARIGVEPEKLIPTSAFYERIKEVVVDDLRRNGPTSVAMKS